MPEENKEKPQKKRWTLKKVKTRCRTIYWQNFLLTASVVMLTLALLGSAFFALTYSYAIDERSEQMQSKATVVSHTSPRLKPHSWLAMPTAMPEPPLISRFGMAEGRTVGS